MRTTCRHFLVSLLSAASLVAACTAPNPEFRAPMDAAMADLVSTPDVPFIPSHIGPEWFTRSAASLTLQHTIDTSSLTIDGLPPPPGILFVDQQGMAVLAVKSLNVPGQADVRVRGTRPLVIVAGSSISISGILDGSGHIDEPGPGGFPADMGQGAGHKGNSSPLDTGGSGAGYGGPGGAAGGVGGNCGMPPAARVNGGSTYGDAAITTLSGGSGGGAGAGAAVCIMGTDAKGGGGGGAIQLTAGDSITISGAINVGGGGGKGGCKGLAPADGAGGGGGGSGGALLVEARIVTLGGFLAANGGGGGGGAFYTPGGNGADGLATADSAPGGAGGKDLQMGGNEVVSQHGGLGGAMSQGGDSQMAGSCGNSGGGGGGTGRISLRSKTPINAMGRTSPPANIATL